MKTNYQPQLYYDAIDTGGGSDAAIISGSSQIASSAIGAMAQSNLNKRTQKFDEQMYAQQRKDALSDWNMNNAYNAPSAQMARFKAAGLNPNLIYGNQGSMSQAVRSSTPLSWNPKAPDLSGVAQGIGNALSVQLQQRQLDNMKAQTALTDAQTAKIQADTKNVPLSGNVLTDQDVGIKLDNNLKQATLATNIDQAKLDLNKTITDIQNTATATSKMSTDQQNSIVKTYMDIAQGSASIQEALQRIAASKTNQQATIIGEGQTLANTDEIRQRIQNLASDNQIKQYDISLDKVYSQFGMTDKDDYKARMAAWLAFHATATPQDKGKADFPNSAKPNQYQLPPLQQR